MSTAEIVSQLRRRIVSGDPLLWLRTYEEQRWEEELAELASDIGRGLVTWSLTAGLSPPLEQDQPAGDAVALFEQIARFPPEHLFVLKDLHSQLRDPAVCRKLRDLIPLLVANRQTVLCLSPVDDLPVELLKDVTVIDLPLPGADEMRDLLYRVLEQRSDPVELPPRTEDKLVQGVLGLTLNEARRAFSHVLHSSEEIGDETFKQLAAEKRHLIQGSNLLEFFELDEGIDDIGGLDGLKEWIAQRGNAFSADAAQQGITMPRGVLLAGVQGCGKSLSARAISRMLGFPLVRLDFGALLETSRGGSEQNLREVLNLMDTVAPAVLWLEEIDKAFAGFTEEGHSDPVMSRLVGRFLTWLQEHPSAVFVVATANNITSLPPEMLRRGRFDELFFVDLPNYHERLAILEIHLRKRGWKPELYDLGELATATDGYSGAELEQIVNAAIIESFAANRMPTQGDLNDARERLVPLSVTMEDEIFSLREWARTRCRPATIDHRVMQVLEEEERRGEAPVIREIAPKWKQLAEHGQLAAAVIEYVRLHDHVGWPALIRDLAAYGEVRGEYGLVIRADPKTVVWLRVSKQIADICCEAIEARRLYLHIVPAGEYDAKESPQLPAVTGPADDPAHKPTWLPTRLRLLPPPGGSGKLGRLARVKMG